MKKRAGEMLNREKICQRLGNNTCRRAGAELVGKHFSKRESEKYLSKSKKYLSKNEKYLSKREKYL